MKLKNLFRIISLLAVLVSLAVSQTSALASAPQQATGPTATIHIAGPLKLAASSSAMKPGDTVTYAIDLQNLPAEGLTSAEFACRYDSTLAQISGLTDAGLFGTDAVAAINGPSGGTFVFAIAGVSKKATTGGTVFTFSLKALANGSFTFDCQVRASKGTDLFGIGFSPITITISDTTANGTVSGVVTASKPVTITLLSGTTTIGTVVANANGSFSLSAPPGTYTITASASGFLTAQGSVTLTSGANTTKPTIALAAGDVDNNGKIEANDVLTIGINYNKTTPTAADLNNDGIINVLDLQLLAKNYPMTGPTAW